MDISGKNIMILGEGISGKAAFEALKGTAHPFFYRSDEFDGAVPCAIPDLVVTSPGIASHPVFAYAEQSGIPVISEIELGYILNKTPIVAVTGTNGKTTVTRLIGEILAKEFVSAICGNIGEAFSRAALTPHDVAVVEVSSFQLERCYSFAPGIAVITNISPDHLDRHGTMEEYIRLKIKITAAQAADDFLICPRELKPYLTDVKSNIVYSDEECIVKGGEIYFWGEKIMPVGEIKLPGEYNLKNVMQAVCAAKLLGISNGNIAAAVSAFRADPHRLAKISTYGGKAWYNDSKATNIGACLASCRCMTDSTALILGGSDKGYEYDDLFQNLPGHIIRIYIMGEVMPKLKAAAQRAGRAVAEAENLESAVADAAKCTAKNVLLAPASASFDCYKDYKARGEAFKKAIARLKDTSKKSTVRNKKYM